MVGDPAYDWAFWVVYYDLLRDPVPRLRLASAIGEVPLLDAAGIGLIAIVRAVYEYWSLTAPVVLPWPEVMRHLYVELTA